MTKRAKSKQQVKIEESLATLNEETVERDYAAFREEEDLPDVPLHQQVQTPDLTKAQAKQLEKFRMDLKLIGARRRELQRLEVDGDQDDA